MTGATLAVGALAITVTLAVGGSLVAAAAVGAARASGAADAAALAAADAASGAVSGVPCERAEQVAAASAAVVSSCSVEGLIATVQVRVGVGPFAPEARARAGPPPEGAP